MTSSGTSLTKREARKPLITNPLRRGHRRWGVVALAAAGVAVVLCARPTLGSAAAGLPLVLAGALLRIWAAGYLVKTRALAVSGPYAHTRNPLYLGTLLIGSGFALVAGAKVAAIALPIGLLLFFGSYFPRKERKESALLEETFGEPYRAYHAAVPALLPRWRAWTPGDDTGIEPWSFERVRGNSELGTTLTVVLAVTALTVHSLLR